MFLSLALATAAAAATPEAPQVPAKPSKVCKTFDPPVGTRIGQRKICKTQAEWNRENQEAREDMENRQRLVQPLPPS